MYKFLIGLVVIFGIVALILNIVPVAANSNTPTIAAKNAADTQVPLSAIIPAKEPANPVLPTSTPPINPAKKSTDTVTKTAVVTKKAAPVKTPAKTTTTSTSNSVKWAASGLTAIGPLSAFDYSTSIRNSYKRKVEAYARSKGITLITASVVNSMHQ